MAAPRKATAFSFEAIKPEASELVQPGRAKKPNPLHDHVADANTEANQGKWFKIPGIPDEHKKEAYNLLRRAQKDLDCGLSIKEEDLGNGTVAYHYCAGPKKNSTYTTDDVRAWAVNTQRIDPGYTGKLDNTVRAAYREAHGLRPRKSK